MWNLILPIFLLVKATFGEAICSEDPHEVCPNPKIFSMIPKAVSEYRQLCPSLPNYIKCLREFQRTCGSVVFFDSDDEYETLYNFHSELCEEGSLLNSIVIQNLKCLNETFESSLCRDETRSLIQKFKTLDTPNKKEDLEELPLDLECLKNIHEAACITADLSKKCGSIVKETAYDMIRRSNYIEYSCPTEAAKHLLDSPKAIDLQMKYQDFFYNIMGKFSIEEFGSGFL